MLSSALLFSLQCAVRQYFRIVIVRSNFFSAPMNLESTHGGPRYDYFFVGNESCAHSRYPFCWQDILAVFFKSRLTIDGEMYSSDCLRLI